MSRATAVLGDCKEILCAERNLSAVLGGRKCSHFKGLSHTRWRASLGWGCYIRFILSHVAISNEDCTLNLACFNFNLVEFCLYVNINLHLIYDFCKNLRLGDVEKGKRERWFKGLPHPETLFWVVRLRGTRRRSRLLS